mmetsp:Transcript_37403/g.79797  ORF Transcript_37403/g.79797 Transcript_37403/m.79797 type:complete len:419 (-) Transcript_37403:716-1972(-)
MKIMEVATAVLGEGNEDFVALFVSQILALPLPDVQGFILSTNTPELRDFYLQSVFTGASAGSLDTHVLSLGRPADGLEEASTQCYALQALYPPADVLNQYFDLLSPGIEASLNATLSMEIKQYKCGILDAFIEDTTAALGSDDELSDLLLTNRNIQMATKMNEILKANPNEKVFFAVGAAHWNIGNYSFEILLKDYGYTLEHVPNWDSEHAEDHSNEHCGVVLNNETGAFVPDDLFAANEGVHATNKTAHPVESPTAPSGSPSRSSVKPDPMDNSTLSSSAPSNEPSLNPPVSSALSSFMPSNRPSLTETNRPSTSMHPPGLSSSDPSMLVISTSEPSIQLSSSQHPSIENGKGANPTMYHPAQDANTSTKMPSGTSVAEGSKEGRPSFAAAEPSSSATIGTSKLALVGGLIYLLSCT